MMKSCIWLALFLLLASVPSLGFAQQTDSAQKELDPSTVQKEVSKLNGGEVSPYGLHLIGKANAREAIPALKKQFFIATHQIDRAQIAAVLVKLKEPDEIYWNYLVQLVTPVLDDSAPSPIATDAQGKELPGVAPAFEAWVDANKLDPPIALQNATIVYPGYMIFLGETGDTRAVPLLRRAVASPNFLIAAQASEALAQLQDEGAVSLITDAASRAPASAAKLIAEPLGYFSHSSEAQAALDKYVPKERAQAVRERVRLGKRPLD